MTIVRIGLAVVAASTFLGPGPAHGQSAEATLGGFSGTAAASGLHAVYAPVGLLPTGPPLDLGSPDALATIATGPATFARASVADPGDLLANPDALLTLASGDYPQGTIPAYPYRVSARSGVGKPSDEVAPAPGLGAKVTAEGNRSSAVATMPALEAPAIATVGSMAARATTETDGSTVTVHARSELSEIDVLGVIRIDSLVIDLVATSDGEDTTLEGGTTVSGATLMGTPIAIDEEGVRGSIGPVDVNQVLKLLGLSLTLPGPMELDGEQSGQLAATGLRLVIDESDENVPGLTDVLNGLPVLPAQVEDLLAIARARHLVTIDMGHGLVSLDARTAVPFTPFTPPAADVTPTPPYVPPAESLAPISTPTVTPRAPDPAPPTLPTEEAVEISLGTGVGALAAVLLLVQPWFGDRLARIAGIQLANYQETCPWERP